MTSPRHALVPIMLLRRCCRCHVLIVSSLWQLRNAFSYFSLTLLPPWAAFHRGPHGAMAHAVAVTGSFRCVHAVLTRQNTPLQRSALAAFSQAALDSNAHVIAAFHSIQLQHVAILSRGRKFTPTQYHHAFLLHLGSHCNGHLFFVCQFSWCNWLWFVRPRTPVPYHTAMDSAVLEIRQASIQLRCRDNDDVEVPDSLVRNSRLLRDILASAEPAKEHRLPVTEAAFLLWIEQVRKPLQHRLRTIRCRSWSVCLIWQCAVIRRQPERQACCRFLS